MNVDILEPIGAVLTDLDVAGLDGVAVGAMRDLLAEHGVVVIPNQDIDDEAFLSFLRSFGALLFTEGETPLDGFPDLNVITNVGRATPPTSSFHVDTTYVPVPPAYTALRAVEVPNEGGQTLFSNQYAAFSTLPADLRADIERRSVTHTVTGLEGIEGSAEHPLVTVHPISGRQSLYLSTPARCTAVSGLTAENAADLVRRLVDHSTAEKNVYRHSWSPGDVVMWDNRVVMHRADHSGVVGDRTMHRGMVAAGDRPRA